MIGTSDFTFFKLHANGNDFVAIDNMNGALSLDEIIRITPILCKRRFGVGADGLLALFPAANENEHFTMIYRNADGSDAGMCGNGGRCLARLAVDLGMPDELHFRVHNDRYKATVDGRSVCLELPATPSVIQLPDDVYGTIYVVHTGTDHIVVEIPSDNHLNKESLRSKGQKLRFDPRFSPGGTNVNFFSTTSPNHIRITTYERGVEDLTLACGTGSVAAAIVHAERSHAKISTCGQRMPQYNISLPVSVRVTSAGGETTAHFRYNRNEAVYSDLVLEGPAEVVYKGIAQLPL
jgi:diaminopimelate epimerase